MNSVTDYAFIFPGQGIESRAIIKFLSYVEQTQPIPLLCEFLKISNIAELNKKTDCFINSNLVSSLLTITASLICFNLHKETHSKKPIFLVGYSVGQWTALYVSRSITLEDLFRIVAQRAQLMDEAIVGNPTGMLSVLGLNENTVRSILKKINALPIPCYLSNINCYGNYSVSLRIKDKVKVREIFITAGAYQVVDLTISGGWHSVFLKQAELLFKKYLEKIHFQPPQIPIISNVTAQILSHDKTSFIKELAAHITSPVQWHASMDYLIAKGVTQFIELGYGNLLTRFGFFINRDVLFEKSTV